MQFHVNGFKPGDPDILPAAPGHRRAGDPLPETLDVLIAGSGPAGLCLAAQLARIPQIRTLLVEPKLGPMEKGQADGISVRSMEMFQAFGFAGKVMRESVWINETTFRAPGANAPLTRVARVHDVPDGISEMPHVLRFLRPAWSTRSVGNGSILLKNSSAAVMLSILEEVEPLERAQRHAN